MSPVAVLGFAADDIALAVPPVPVGDAVQERLMLVLAAIVSGGTPEEIMGYLADGFPPTVQGLLSEPFAAEEFAAFVDLLLVVQQSPVPARG